MRENHAYTRKNRTNYRRAQAAEAREYSLALVRQGKNTRVIVAFSGDPVDLLTPPESSDRDPIRTEIQINILKAYAAQWTMRHRKGRNLIILKPSVGEHDSLSEEVSAYRAGTALDVFNNTFSSVSTAAITLFKLSCLGVSACLAARGQIEAGTVILFETYFSMLIDSTMKVMERVPDVAAGIRCAESISELMCTSEEEPNGNVRLSGAAHREIELRDVSYTYQDTGIQALNGFDLMIPAGARIAVTGGSGSGKSTLLNLITGSLVPQEGSELVNGIPLSELDIDHYRRRIAVVPQETVLFAGTLWENLIFGAPLCFKGGCIPRPSRCPY